MDKLLADQFEALRQAQPSWMADTLGVSGNPVEFHKEQASVEWPPAVVTRLGQGVDTGQASSGFPGPPDTVRAT